jgi:hypothetical protein
MIFRQHMTITDLALYAWASRQTDSLRVLDALANFRRDRAERLSAWTLDNVQLVTATAVGLFIGLSAGTLLADQLIFAIGAVASLWSLVMLQLPLQHGPQMRQREPLPAEQGDEQLYQQQVQIQTIQQNALRAIASMPDVEAVTPLVEDVLRHLHD